MKNPTLGVLAFSILFLSIGCTSDSKKLTERNFLINDGGKEQFQLHKDFQKEEYNLDGPDHNHRTEASIGEEVTFENISKPKNNINESLWYVYPFGEDASETADSEGLTFSYTFEEVGSFVIQMKTNGKDVYKVVRVIPDDGAADADGDGVPDSEDDCPNEYGEAATNGCPDDDNDGIANLVDDCPNEKGIPEKNGCPPNAEVEVNDADNDGIADSKDRCPDDAGTIKSKGCPDADNDGVADKDDACPDEKGLFAYEGCLPPDTDGDGFTDDKDRCIDEVGTLRGCPDRDGDSVADIDDDCPDEKGKISTNGCPVKDSDNDGIADEQDACPEEYGTLNGCPDADNDGIADKDDKCPNESGDGTADGCPIVIVDTDKDGLPDEDDDCPTEKGTLNGCPDDDGDGIANKDDSCPNESGPGTSDGCPIKDKDSDGDTFVDSVDNCPDEKGTLNGCPDDDNDGIANKDDKCPNESGDGTADGCPKDSDGDSFVDAVDKCPNEKGTLNGCPDSDGDGIANNVDKCPNKNGGGNSDGCPTEIEKKALVPPSNGGNTGISSAADGWYPTNGPSMVGVTYSRCANSHNTSQWESNKTTLTLTPTTNVLLHSAKVYASTSGKLRLELKGQKGEIAKTTLSVNRGSTDLPLDDLDLVLIPGETYYLSITPLKTGDSVVQLDNIATCNPTAKSSSNMTVSYDSGKMVLFNLKFEH